MTNKMAYNCSQHTDSENECRKKLVCNFYNNQCRCNPFVSGDEDSRQCGCGLGYTPTADMQDCRIVCQAGQKAISLNQCQECEDGTWSEENALQCQQCKDPTPMATPDHTSCITQYNCERIAHAVAYNDKQCQCLGNYDFDALFGLCVNACPPGTYMNEQQCYMCDDGMYSLGRTTRCAICPSGLVANVLHNQCITPDMCEPMSFVDNNQCRCVPGYVVGDDGCKVCDDGQVSTDGKQCEKCSDRTDDKMFASVDHSICISESDCRVIIGAVPDSTQNQCRCEQLGFQLNNEGKQCVNPCAAGYYLTEDGHCARCGPGEVSVGGTTLCKKCVAPNGVSSPGHTQCITEIECTSRNGAYLFENECRCAAGYMVSKNGLSCAECPGGYVSYIGELTCLACGMDMVSDLRRQECVLATECGPNTDVNQRRQCMCKQGYGFNEQMGMCVLCGPGTYSPTDGNLCFPCPDDTISTEGATSCLKCETGMVANDQRTQCVSIGHPDPTDSSILVILVPVTLILGIITGILVIVAQNRQRDSWYMEGAREADEAAKQFVHNFWYYQ